MEADWEFRRNRRTESYLLGAFLLANVAIFEYFYSVMDRLTLYILIVLLAVSCRNGAPAAVQTTTDEPFEDTVYCFNQRSIVHRDGKAGMIGENDYLILTPEWDSIEFLDDEIALLSRGDTYYLCTRDGRVFADSKSENYLESNFKQLLSETLENDIRKWDSVLDKLEALCESCLRCKNRRPDKTANEANEAFQKALSEADGNITPSLTHCILFF